MGIWQNFFKTFSNRPQVELPASQTFHFNGENKVLDYAPYKWYKENPFVFAAINERSKAFSRVKFYIRREDGELIENSLTESLNNPNQYQSLQDFLLQYMTFKSITGTGYVYLNKLRPSSEPEFINLFADNLTFENFTNINFTLNQLMFKEDTSRILYGDENISQKVVLNKEYLLPFFDTASFRNPYYAESRLKSQRYIVSNIQSALESQNTFLSSPGGIGILNKKWREGLNAHMTPKEKEDLERELQKSHGSLTGQRNITITNVETEYISTVPNIEGLKLNDTMIQCGLILFQAFGLPKEAFTALMSGSTFENQSQAFKKFIQLDCQNEADNLAMSINKAIPSVEGELIASYDHLPIMQEDEKMRADVDAIVVNTGLQLRERNLTLNEIYETLNR